MSVPVPRRSGPSLLDTHEPAARALASSMEIRLDLDQIAADAGIQSRSAWSECVPTREARRHALGRGPAAGA